MITIHTILLMRNKVSHRFERPGTIINQILFPGREADLDYN